MSGTSGSEEGSYLRLVEFVPLNSRPRVIKKKRRDKHSEPCANDARVWG